MAIALSGSLILSGSITVSGSIISTGTISMSGSIASASYASNADTLDGLDSTVFTLTSSFIAQTASFTAFTSSINSFSASILAQTASLNSFSSSVLTFTGSAATRLGALEAATASLYTATSSFSGRLGALEAATASLYTATSSLNAFSASLNSYTSSTDAKIASIYSTTSSLNTRIGTLEAYTSSLNNKTSSFATTGSNTFIGTQTITGSVLQSGSFTSTGTLTAQTLVVQTITSSVIYSSGSNVFGNNIANTQVFSGSLYQTGSLAFFAGSVSSKGTLTIGDAGITNAIINSADGMYFNIDSDVSGGNPEFMFGKGRSGAGSGGTTFMTVNASGSVGIGTTSPASKLTIESSTYDDFIKLTRTSVGSMGISATNPRGIQTTDGAGNFLGWHVSASGNVGIGTTSPTEMLHVGGDVRFAGNTYLGGIINVYQGDASIWVPNVGQAFTVKQNTGNVGIGTTNPTNKLVVQGGASFRGGTNVTQANYNDSGSTVDIIVDNQQPKIYSSYWNGTEKNLYLGTYSQQSLLVLTTGGNVGIGTTSPSAKLQIANSSAGSLVFDAHSSAFDGRYALLPGLFSIGTLGNGYPEAGYNFTTSNSVYTKIGNDTAWGISYGNSNLMAFKYAAAGTGTFSWNTAMAINLNGNVGIGTTSPSYKLEVNLGSGNSGIVARFNAPSYDEVNISAGLSNWIGTNSTSAFSLRTNNTDKLTILSGGSIGVGTTSPFTKFHVSAGYGLVNNGYSWAVFNSASNGFAAQFGAADDVAFANTGNNAIISAIGSNAILFGTNATEKMRIASDGNVGIGTTTPKAKLQVLGSISSEKKYDGMDSGLVLYYPFAENTGTTTADRSQTGMIGTLTNGPTWTTSIMGYGLTLDGSNDYVSVAAPDSSVSFGTTMAYSMWIYPTSTTAQRYYLMDPRGDGSTGGMDSYWLFDRVNSSTVTFTTGNSGVEVISSNVTMGTNQWYHVAAVRSGSNWKIYLNGIEIKSGTTNSTSLTLSNSFRIGTYSGAGAGPQYYFQGNIDEAKIWNRTLSGNEVMLLYQQGVGTNSPYTNASGSIGIGTTNPSSSLHVVGSNGGNDPYAHIRINATGTYPNNIAGLAFDNSGVQQHIRFLKNGTEKFQMRYNEGGTETNKFHFYSFITNADFVTFDANGGNVGIGTTSPGAKLHVLGTAKIENSSSARYFSFITDSASSYLDVSHNIYFRTNGASSLVNAMQITSAGDIFIGAATTGAGERLIVAKSEAAPLALNRLDSDGGVLRFYQDSTEEGNVTVAGNTVSYNSFLGSHWSQLQDGSKPTMLKGTILEAIDELCVWENETNDRLPKSKISNTIESKNVYGIFLDWDEEWKSTNDFFVAAVGLGYIRVHSSQNITIGDLLQSNGDGTAKIQLDDIIRSSTIAKVVSTQKIKTYEDGSYLIAATLHCG